jgi:hypothetical protein
MNTRTAVVAASVPRPRMEIKDDAARLHWKLIPNRVGTSTEANGSTRRWVAGASETTAAVTAGRKKVARNQ